MSIVAPNAATGQGLYEGTVAFRDHDDLCDNKVAGVYTHVATRYSATECEELSDLHRWHNSILQSGPAPLVFNGEGISLSAGTLGYLDGFMSGCDLPIFLKAQLDDPSKCAKYVLLDAIDTGETGAAYPGGVVTGLDTSAANAIMDAVYAGVDGAFSTVQVGNAPVVGWVAVKDASSGQVNFFIQPAQGEFVSAHTLSPVTITAGQSGTVFTNTGATTSVTFNLPKARRGLTYTFITPALYVVTVTCQGGDYIKTGSSVSTSGGNMYTNGGQIYGAKLYAIDDNTWSSENELTAQGWGIF